MASCASSRWNRSGVDVTLVDDEFARARAVPPQFRNHVAVDLDHLEPPAALEQRPGQRAEPGSDLDQPLAGLRIDRGDDTREHARVVQEMLPEALAGADHPSSSASPIAANRLPGSARPLPARSSAVPWSTDVRQ